MFSFCMSIEQIKNLFNFSVTESSPLGFIICRLPKLSLDKPVQCKLCGKFFLTKTTLSYHVQLKCKHPAVKNFAKKFSRRTRDPEMGELPPGDKRKQTKIASDDKNRCSYCGKRFLRPCQVKRHEVVHTKEKKYQCSLCLKGECRKCAF